MSERTTSSACNGNDEGYAAMETIIGAAIAETQTPLFQTDANTDELWAAYLNNLPDERRQHYACLPAGVSSSGMAVWFKSCGAERPRLCFLG